jgi:hypothetical protein
VAAAGANGSSFLPQAATTSTNDETIKAKTRCFMSTSSKEVGNKNDAH